ncbi:hypothetical protein [Granulicella sp. L46]|uniref:hypothetical protein n=1 Tax=Granulicella sp. L46 TaxID=1641865 RepID=UPI00131D22B9|nr:hypothetical protein [Granulicella sp. L46]
MSRYRKVEVRTWGDEKFRKLSPMPSCGQGLWLYLMTGPHTTSVPGLFRAGRAALAEALGWSQDAFDKAFEEVFREGMAKADWHHRVVWIPNAIKHNQPANPNVVKSWWAELDLIPECELKVVGVAGIAAGLAAMNPVFSEAFALLKQPSKTSGKPSAKHLGKVMANQEQQQEQEQQETLALTAVAVVNGPMSADQVERVYAAYPRHVGKAKAIEAIRKAVVRLGTGKDFPAMDCATALVFLLEAVVRFAGTPAGNAGKFTPYGATWFNQARYFDNEKEWLHGTNTGYSAGNGAGALASRALAAREQARAAIENGGSVDSAWNGEAAGARRC